MMSEKKELKDQVAKLEWQIHLQRKESKRKEDELQTSVNQHVERFKTISRSFEVERKEL